MAKNKQKELPDATPTDIYGDGEWLRPSWLMRDLTASRCETLEALEVMLDEQLSRERGRLAEQRRFLDDESWEGDDDGRQGRSEAIDDDEALLGKVMPELKLCLVVALYHHVEDQMKQLLTWRLSGLPKAVRDKVIRDAHRWPAMASAFQTYFGTDVHSIDGAKSVELLREMANAGKHRGALVSPRLAEMTGWSAGKPIPLSALDLKRYQKAVVEFIEALTERAEAGTRERHGDPP